MKKWIVRGIGLVLLLLLVTAGGAYLYLDSLARAAIEHGARQATGVRTTVQQVDVRPMSGVMGVSKLEINNPPGFSGSPFLELGQGDMQVSVMSLLGQTVDVKKLSLDHIDVNLLRQGGRSNYQTILTYLQAHAGDTKSGKKFIIHKLDVTHVTVTLTGFPGGTQTLDLPPIHMTNIGNAQGAHGLRLSDVTGLVIQAIFSSLARHPEKLPKVLIVTAGQSIDSLGKAGASFFSATLKALGGTAGDTSSTLAHGLGGLFGGNHAGSSNATQPADHSAAH